ncbi:metal-dependent hydrolase [Natronosalvus vescus]|uniref:metal-dependent hydrolase n=1 Tax=Natronosalvus vescus TaxID=2953881 RepID=UPI0020901C96|nr:metal-dependent hydrolase [Natronosalvus vescus]
MQPFVHPVVGYLCYVAYARFATGEAPREAPVLAALVGATLPDLIDKPLVAVGVVDVGRTIGHSVVAAVPLVLAVWLVATRVDQRELGIAFAIGYASHLAADVPWHLLAGEYDELGFLLWPITNMPEYTGVKPLGTIGSVAVTTLWLEAAIFVAGVVLWWHDGRPGLGLVRRWMRGS